MQIYGVIALAIGLVINTGKLIIEKVLKKKIVITPRQKIIYSMAIISTIYLVGI